MVHGDWETALRHCFIQSEIRETYQQAKNLRGSSFLQDVRRAKKIAKIMLVKSSAAVAHGLGKKLMIMKSVL